MKRACQLLLCAILGMTSAIAQVDRPNVSYRPAAQNSSNVFTGYTNEFYFAGQMSQPQRPLATQGASTGGSCSSARTYRFYVSYANASGHTELSPPSYELTPTSGTTNLVTLTIPAGNIPWNAASWSGWFTSDSDNHVTVYGCGASGAEETVDNETLTFSCKCSTTTDAIEPTSNTTANVYPLRVGAGPDGVYVSTPSRRIVDICPVGCQYSTLKSACAANTSTAASPLIFYVHAGTYSTGGVGTTAEQNCTGQTSATIRGDGEATRIINTSTDSGDFGALSLGNSTNITLEDMYIKGHRAVWCDGCGGRLTFRNLILQADSAQLDNDCEFLKNQPANSVRRDDNVRCFSFVDGFTQGTVTPPFYWYMSNNYIDRGADGTNTSGGAVIIGAIPTFFSSVGDVINISTAWTGNSGAASVQGYRFIGTDTGCTSGCTASIVAPTIHIANTDAATEGATVRGIEVYDDAAELASVNVISPDVILSTTVGPTTGTVQGVYVNNTTSYVYVTGGRFRTSGGNTNLDFDGPGNQKIVLTGVDYQTGAAADLSFGDVRNTWASVNGRFASGTPTSAYPINIATSASESSIGILLENTDAVNDEPSPLIRTCNSAHAGSVCWDWKTYANDQMFLGDTSETYGLRLNSATHQAVLDGIASLQIGNSSEFGVLYVGAGNATDNNQIVFNSATTQAALVWNDTSNRLAFTSVDVYRYSTLASAPASCSIGDVYIDSTAGSVAMCLCTATNTWTAVGGTGTCL